MINECFVLSESIILFVDDGSKDSMWLFIEKESCSNLFVKGLKLVWNVGY